MHHEWGETVNERLYALAPLGFGVERICERCYEAKISSGRLGAVELWLHDVLGRRLEKYTLMKENPEIAIDLGQTIKNCRPSPLSAESGRTRGLIRARQPSE